MPQDQIDLADFFAEDDQVETEYADSAQRMQDMEVIDFPDIKLTRLQLFTHFG